MTDTNLVYPYEFEGGKKAVASEVNANFEAVKSFANGINADLYTQGNSRFKTQADA